VSCEAPIDRGNGPPVLLVHGLAGFKEAWGTLPDTLVAGGFRAVAVDLPGSGAAAAPRRGRVDSGTHARALGPLVRELAPVAVVAHSLGAQVALGLAAAHGERVGAIALLAPVVAPWTRRRIPRGPARWLLVPGLGPPLARLVIAALRRDPGRRRAAFLGAVGEPGAVVAGSPEAELLDEAADRLARADLRAFTSWASAALRTGALAEAAHTVAPTLVITGARDRLTPAADTARLVDALPAVRAERLDRVGHFPHLERPDVVGQLIVGHLRASGAASWGR